MGGVAGSGVSRAENRTVPPGPHIGRPDFDRSDLYPFRVTGSPTLGSTWGTGSGELFVEVLGRRPMKVGESGRKARDVMHEGVQCIGEHESLRVASQMMCDLGVGALPICGDDDRLKGIITDRDIVVLCCAHGMDIDQTTAGELARGLVWVDADASLEEALFAMEQHHIKRLPVLEDRRLAGIISEADLAKELADSKLAEFVHRVYALD